MTARTPPMLPDEVRCVMVRMGFWKLSNGEPISDTDEWDAIKAHLLAREAEVADADRILRSSVPDPFKAAISPVGGAQGYIAHLEHRCERAEALLRECLSRLGPEWTRGNIPINPDASLHNRITATLLEKDNGPLRK